MTEQPNLQFCFKCNKTMPYGTCCTLKDCPWVAITFPGRDPLLQEREKTHGSFEKNAMISQALKRIFHKDINNMNEVHTEALDMIALKLSRILSGQANFKDHWRDISGYSLLAMEACDGQ